MTLWEKWAEIRRTKEQRGDGNEDLVFASVFDGCGGSAAVSELLQKTLHACLASALAVADRADPLAFTKAISDTFVLSFPFPLRLTRDDQLRSMGQGCSSSPLDLLEINFAGGRDGRRTFPNPAMVAMANSEYRGSCALTTIIDVAHDKVYVANVGDSRAVAGWWNQAEAKWRCDILSNDHEGENEIERSR